MNHIKVHGFGTFQVEAHIVYVDKHVSLLDHLTA